MHGDDGPFIVKR